MHFSPVLPRSYPFLTCSASSSSVSHLSCLVLIHFSPVLSRPQPFLTCFASSPSPLHIFPRRSPISYLFCLFLIQFLTCSASSASTFHHSTSTSFAFSPVLPLPSPLSHLLCLFLLRFLRLTLLAAHGLGGGRWFLFRYVFFHRWSITQQRCDVLHTLTQQPLRVRKQKCTHTCTRVHDVLCMADKVAHVHRAAVTSCTIL